MSQLYKFIIRCMRQIPLLLNRVECFCKKSSFLLNNSLWFKTDAPLFSNHDPTFVNAHCTLPLSMCNLRFVSWWVEVVRGRKIQSIAPDLRISSPNEGNMLLKQVKRKTLIFYGYAKMSLDWGRNITWTMHASLDSCAFEGSNKKEIFGEIFMSAWPYDGVINSELFP